MGVKVPGRLAWATAAIAVLVAALVVLVHTPPAARWGRAWLVGQVATRWQLDLETSRLRINLFSRRVTLEDVRLSAPGHADRPILTARRLEAELPWAVFAGTVRLSMLEVDDARVLLVREGGTLVNLSPPSGDPPPEVARRLDLRGLRVRGLDVDYVDRTGDVEVAVTSLAAALDERDIRIFTGASGTLTAQQLRVRIGAHETSSAGIEGRMAFDGSAISLQALAVPLPEGRIEVDGRIDRVLDDMRFALTLAGSLDYATVAAWTPPPVPVSGAGRFEGTFDGPLGGYELRAAFTSPALSIGRAAGLPLTGTLSVTPPRAVIEPFAIIAPASPLSPRQGVIDGRFTYEFGLGTSELTAQFRDLDLDVALAAYDQEPVTFAAWQRGSLTLRRETPRAPITMRASGVSTALLRADRVAVTGTWTATLQNERWFAEHDHRLLDVARAYGTVAWPAAEDSTRALLNGPLTLDIADVGAVVSAARRSGINVSESLAGVTGPADGTLAMGGSIARLVISGRVESGALALPTGAPATALADIVYDGDTLRATRFELDTPGLRMSGDASMGMTSGRLTGAFAADADDLVQLMAPWPATARLTGTIHVSGTLGGTTETPDIPFTLRSTPIDVEGQHLGVIDANARLRGTIVEVERLTIEQGPGQLRATGTVDYLTGAYDLTVAGQQLRWLNPASDATVEAVALDVEFSGAGTLETPGGSGVLSALPVGGSIGDFVGTAELRWWFSGGLLNATAFLPKLRTWAQAAIEPRAPYATRGTAVVNALDVQPFALAGGALTDAVSGTVGLSASFEGRLSEPDTLQAFVNLQDVALSVGGLPVRLERPARLTVRRDDFSVDDLALAVGRSAFTAAGRFHDTLAAPLRAALIGELSDVVALGRSFGVLPDVDANGRLTATWESRGSIEQARSTAAVANATIAVAGYPPVEALAATATFDGSTVALEALSATWQGGAMEGRAQLPRRLFEPAASAGPSPAPSGRVDVTLKGLTEQALVPWLPAATIAGLEARVSATLGLDLASLDLGGISGTLVLDEAAVTAAGVPIAQVQPSRLSIADGTLSFDDVAFSAGAPVVIAGTIAFGDATALNVTLTGTPGLRPFSVLTPGIAMDGAAALDLHVSGTPAAPLVDGRVDLESAEMVMRDPRVIASDLTGPILFAGDRVTLGNITGSLNGGDVEASGTVRVLGAGAVSGEFIFQAQRVAVEYPKNVDSEIDALLTFAPGAVPTLKGDVRVLRGAYRATISLPALVAFNATRTVPMAQPGYLDSLRLDLSISTEDDIVIDNNYGRFEAGANVRLQGTGARPALTGRAELREGGEMFVLGGLYRLNESAISFSNPNAIEPDLNISMVTRSNGAEQTLTLSGTLDRLQTSVVSSDPSADTSLAALLLGGDSALDGDSALRLLSGELLGVTGRVIGLDSLRVERGFDINDVRQDPGLIAENVDPSTRLTLSKQVSADVEVVLSQGIGQGALSGYVTYRPLRGVELRGTSLDNTDRLLSVRHDISFGGAVVAAASYREYADVSTVTVDGATAADEAALRSRLRLKGSDRFDFIRWRDDVERLRAWYRERGFLEARVRASRADERDGRVALTYRIERGPATQLLVDGMAVSGRLRRQLEEAWSNAVFDRFLLDEIEGELSVELVRRNIVNAEVAAVVESAAPVKVIRATVQNGQAAERRRIVYEGARALTPGQLDAEIAVWELTDYGWLYPPSIANALTSRYDAEGYRAARASAAAPVVVGAEALLTLTIEEGPVTTVTRATSEGGVPSLDAAVHPFVTALEDRPYRYGEVDAVVRRIENRYQAAGYNHVRVTPAVTAPPESTSATVVFQVDAGPEQRLAEVVVSGAERTRPQAVVNALGLDEGKPVDLAQWAQARKRVYDTNVFRQVDVRPEVMPQQNADGSEAVRARVTLTEWPTWRLRYGLQLDDRNQSGQGEDTSQSRRRDLGVVANLQNRNVFGRAFTFGLYGQVARRLQSSNTYLTFPTLFGRAVQTNVFASSSRQDLPTDETEEFFLRRTRRQLSVEQRVRRGRALEIAYGYRLKREVIDALDPEDPFYLAPLTGRFTAGAFFDRRDNPFDATRGWFSSFSVERVSEFESNEDAIKVQGSLFHYRALGPVLLASAARLGGSFLSPLSFGERFYVGGADTVRGYGEGLVGPKTIVGSARGGSALLILNQEVRTPIYRWIRGVAFVDAGNVFASNSALTISGLEVGYGVGLRLHTPFSVLRIDLGVPARGQRTARWYFGLGQIF
ncbi:MAG: translocation/assembly module TamB domain-containing protein [Acidobacteria bacterium]|nr:translocation/assembly module TamB domain-containing protein [Acidobacteriota bacterium]